LGNPDLSVVRILNLMSWLLLHASLTFWLLQVCFDAPKLDTLRVGDEMSKLGWSLNALQSPTCLHICLTGIHTRDGVISSLVADLRKSVRAAADGPPPKDGMGAIYGMTGSVPTSMVRWL
jgi:sphinganine-1-phosphate aldolase